MIVVAAEAAQSELTERITNTGLLLSLLCFVLGAAALVVELLFMRKQVQGGEGSEGTLTEQGAVTDAIDSVAKLATAIKDLRASSQLFVLSIAFLAVAAVAAGTDAVASAVAN